VISVTTTEKGANPEIIDASITNVIETSVNSVPGIEHIQSSSSPGVSNVTITFGLDKRVDVAFNEVQTKVNQVLRRLPKDVDPPVVAKQDTSASPIMWMALRGDRTQQQLNQYALNVLKKRLETINGIGEIRLGGRRDRTIRINLLPQRMAALGVTAQDLQNAFAREHVQLPGGFMVGQKSEYLFKLDMEFHTLSELGSMIVSSRDGVAIRVKDVAEIEDGLGDFRQLAHFNGERTVGIGIVKIANSNTVAIIDEVKRRLDSEIRPQLPPGMTIEIASNDALYIQEIINSLLEHLVAGTLLRRPSSGCSCVRYARPSSSPSPFPCPCWRGRGDVFQRLHLQRHDPARPAAADRVVVDDAIVVLENIYRHRETIDQDPVNAALNGSKEVVFAVLAATLSLVSIFAPVIFMSGIIGQFFKAFAVVVTFGVLVSLFVSLTLTPMLCSRHLTISKQHVASITRWMRSSTAWTRPTAIC